MMHDHLCHTTRAGLADASALRAEARDRKRLAILRMLSDGVSCAEIGRALGLSVGTVRAIRDRAATVREAEQGQRRG